MTFYIKPPGGKISLSSLYKDAETRLLFLSQLQQCWGDSEAVQGILTKHPTIAANSDCLIDGSRKDRNSHYVLRLACLGSRQFAAFLVEAESQLLEHRLMCGGGEALRACVTGLRRHITFALKQLRLSPAHHHLLLQTRDVANHIVASGMMRCVDKDSCQHSIKVPWTLVDDLVKDRNVLLSRGMAEIHCNDLIQLMSSIFRKTIEKGIKQLSQSEEEEPSMFHDARMVRVKKNLCRVFRRHQGSGHFAPGITKPLYHDEVESQLRYFPLCMQGLHKTLEQHNRLRHHSRFRYTLFLKDVGMSWQENVSFWETFYSRPHSGVGAGCCHTWEGHDRARYTYSIRHLYGMEGGKVNYTSHSCSALQDLKAQPQEPSGCPFTSPDIEEELTKLTSTPSSSRHSHLSQAVVKEARAGRPTAACRLMLASTLLSVRNGGEANDLNDQKHTLVACTESGIPKNRSAIDQIEQMQNGILYANTKSGKPKNQSKNNIAFHGEAKCLSNQMQVNVQEMCVDEPEYSCKVNSEHEHAKCVRTFNNTTEKKLCCTVRNLNILNGKNKCIVLDKNIVQVVNGLTGATDRQVNECSGSVKKGKVFNGFTGAVDRQTEECKGSVVNDIVGKEKECHSLHGMNISSLFTHSKDDIINGAKRVPSNDLSRGRDAEVCDLEDITSVLDACKFSRPSQYYLRLMNDK